jgi:hypothetical protein
MSVGRDYMITNGGMKMHHGDEDNTAFYTTGYSSHDSTYLRLIERLLENAFFNNETIFADPLTTYKILSFRQICIDLNKNYPKYKR